jgi:hypothetical protein
MCDKYDYAHRTDCIILSLYYNFIEQEIVLGFDHLHICNTNAKRKVNMLTLENVPRHLSWSDDAFSEKRFRDILDNIVGFNDNINSDLKHIGGSLISKIREGIKNGTIIKEYKPDGTYIWKKIKK